MEPRIVNADPKYSPIDLIEPAPCGYLHMAAEVRPTRFPFMRGGREKEALLARIKRSAYELQQLDIVRQASVFDAIVIPPVDSKYLREHEGSIRIPRFDVVVLIETTSPDTAREVEKTQQYQGLQEALISQSSTTHIIAAKNIKRVADVDRSRKGLFLFNYFAAENTDIMLRLWDYIARWYQLETGLNNSMVLAPLEGEQSDYIAINHARWDISLPVFLARQLSKKSFRSFVLANLEANQVASMPIMYRLA